MNFHENYIEEKDTSSLDSLIFFNEPCTATIVISFFFSLLVSVLVIVHIIEHFFKNYFWQKTHYK